MGLTFLAPAFLFGLAALGVPILVHLIHRDKREAVAFPSLLFLQRIPYRSVRRQKLRHVLLFALRCLALVLLVAAFARPFLARRSAIASAAAGGREVVILLDRSYSMAYGDRWARAVGAVRSAVDALAPSDRATLVLFSDAAAAATQRTGDRAILRAAIAAARPGSGTTRYAPALKLAAKTLDGSDLPRREVLLITDFQRVGWDGREDVRLPANVKLTTTSVAGGATSNVSLTTVELRREFLENRERVAITARLTNKGATRYGDLAVALDLDGKVLESKTATLEPNSSTLVAFTAFPLPEGTSRATVRAGRDALPQDNAFHFVLRRGQALSVLVLEPTDARARQSLYLRRALALGERPPFRVDVRQGTTVTAQELRGRSLVVLNETGMSEDGARILSDFVRQGGGLVVALGDRATPRGWTGAAAALLPATFAGATDRLAERGGTLGFVDRSHPVFDVFSAPRSGDFSAARFYRYRPIQLQGTEGVLARFDDGAVALAESRLGAGRVLVWASTLDTYWNDLPLQPVFLPFVHQVAKHAAGYADERPWYTAGQTLRLAPADSTPRAMTAAAPATQPRQIAVVTPSGERVRLAATGAPPTLALAEQGFYEVRDGERPGDARVVAVNLDPAESDLSSLDPAELAAAVTARPGGSAGAAEAEALTPAEQEQRQVVWWYLLAVAFLLLAAETVLSNRLSRVAR